MNPNIPSMMVGFALLLLLFRLVELLRPKAQRLRVLRRGFWTDLSYFFLSPLVARLVVATAMVAVLAPVAWAIYGKVDHNLIEHGYGPVSHWPLWVQAIGIVVLTEMIGYWMHRAFHALPWLWKFHAVHHSSVDLDWLSAARVHPGNDVVMKIATIVPVVSLGFAPVAVAGVLPMIGFLAIAVHARLDWDFGPLRALIVSPRFHRWHHSDEAPVRNRNFAGLLPAIDILFGTYYMPRDVRPASFGAGGTRVPDGVLRQLAFPFRQTQS